MSWSIAVPGITSAGDPLQTNGPSERLGPPGVIRTGRLP